MEFASVQDVEELWRSLTEEERARTTKLIPVIADTLRLEAEKVGKDLDLLAEANPSYLNVLRSVIVDVVARTLMTSTDREPMTQYSESALGYSVSGTFLTPGGGLFIKNSELQRLGLKKQRYGVIDFYGDDPWNNRNPN